MKKYVFLLLLYLIAGWFEVNAQVAINTDGSPPDSSAMLDVQSANKGFLPPRVALVSADSPAPISNPAVGLVVYNTALAGYGINSLCPGICYWNGQRWKSINKQQVVAYPPLSDSCLPYGSVMDIDGNVYPTVIIGGREWMAQNLKVLRWNDGTPIPLVMNSAEWNDLETPSCTFPYFNFANKETLGVLYKRDVIGLDGVNRLCPEGWHIPTVYDVTFLYYLADSTGYKMCANDPSNWDWGFFGPPPATFNQSCFSALKAGQYNPDVQEATFWFIDYDIGPQYGYFRITVDISYFPTEIWYDQYEFYILHYHTDWAFSVRCVKDQ